MPRESGRRPRDFLATGDLGQKDPSWRVTANDDPADVAAAWLQHRVVRRLHEADVSIPSMSEAVATDSANSLRAKFRGDRTMSLADLLRWAMSIDPAILALIPGEIQSLAEVLPPEVAPQLSHQTPGGYKRATFVEVGTAPLDWARLGIGLTEWMNAASGSGLAWSITTGVLRREVIARAQSAGIPEGMIAPVNDREGTFAIITPAAPEIVECIFVAPGATAVDVLQMACARAVARMWQAAMETREGLVTVVAGSTAALQLLANALREAEPREPWTLTLQDAGLAGAPEASWDWPDLELSRLDTSPIDNRQVSVYRVAAKVASRHS